MGYKTSVEADCATVFLEGRLAFGSYAEFRASTSAALDILEVRELHLDMAAVEYLDSSAIGMILLLKQKTAAANKVLAITRPSPPVAAVLKVANFGKLVAILP